ncbi:1-phosphofructokinase [Pediococcus claussenii]|uniref:Tagatose-6-phosphate kinase n=1 Tax=Pediococcus claussenii (strain ATCC BAA-344 / DSM 14800 / JCM 18046 / KCTC 3811 / LMG 21948 / P06) TaxID=701521 RepID=G8PCW5_PEDCP|nr:1-phosphofructokinase [Pediococcus claussenii]AEV95100.1 1-phosphofructokinase [Pediococcus claussenii ATCC BAA-344]ANZ70288.1 1-phosphofructokinase [Pediococcus claussenii]ANZ72104.1 1-phosphofructokinase [Pediococcus claussenii]KRN18961.1 pfkB protein [Pediococcus claussenii]
MIYTVTLNPSIDYVVELPKIQMGLVNRLEKTVKFPGGKGINVSRILNEMKVENTALGFVGGFTGHFVTEALSELKLNIDFTEIADDTRINVKIHAEKETELNAKGPEISVEELETFKKTFLKVGAKDVVVFSGSIPENLPQSLYLELINMITAAGAEFAVDTTGEALLKTLDKHPIIIKPNNHELSAIVGRSLKSDDEIVDAARELINKGAQNVLVSMASDGGILVTKREVYRSYAPSGQVINSVGAGDSMLAGFIGEYYQNKNVETAFKRGLACGSATAFSLDIADKLMIKKVYSEINVKKVRSEN